jgi:hypothetical protein
MLLPINRMRAVAQTHTSGDFAAGKIFTRTVWRTHQRTGRRILALGLLLVLLAYLIPSDSIWLQLVKSDLRDGANYCDGVLCVQGTVRVRRASHGGRRTEGTCWVEEIPDTR